MKRTAIKARMGTSSVSEIVTLNGGLSVPLPALELLWRLERDGFDIRLDDDGSVLIGPRQRLSQDDCQAITEHRDHLRALLRYCERVQ
jgi:hypothetical protein